MNKVLVVAFLLVLFPVVAQARDCGWENALKNDNLSVDYGFCPEDRQGDKRLIRVRYTMKDGEVDTASAVIDCKRYIFVESDTLIEKGGKPYDLKHSEEKEQEILLNASYRAIAKKICGK